MTMTAPEAAQFAGCSVSTLRRYRCAWCDMNCLNMLREGFCGAICEKCDPLKRPWPPKKSEAAHA